MVLPTHESCSLGPYSIQQNWWPFSLQRFQLICQICLSLKSHPTIMIEICLSLLGHLCTPVCKAMPAHSSSSVKSIYWPNFHPLNRLARVPPRVLSSLDWWMGQNNVCRDVPLCSSTSNNDHSYRCFEIRLGGAHLVSLWAQEAWTEQEVSLHINMHELKAIFSVIGYSFPTSAAFPFRFSQAVCLWHIMWTGKGERGPTNSVERWWTCVTFASHQWLLTYSQYSLIQCWADFSMVLFLSIVL